MATLRERLRARREAERTTEFHYWGKRGRSPRDCEARLRRRTKHLATSAERMRAHRERVRRGIRRLTIDVSEDDLQALARRGYEGAAGLAIAIPAGGRR
jgi:hypothetical protein